MEGLTLYRYWFLLVYGCYLYFNKGIAYSYLSEITWLIGLLLFVRHFKTLKIAWGKVLGILLFLLVINVIQMIRGMASYAIISVIRDSFIFNYGCFVFIVFIFWEERNQFFKEIIELYRYFPLVITFTFLLRTIFPAMNKLILFGDTPFLMYKNGDLAVHLLITVLLVLTDKLTWNNPRIAMLNYILLIYLFLIASTFTRGGMLSFVVPLLFFTYRSRRTDWFQNIKKYLKWVPLIVALSLPLYLITKVEVEDKEYGRQIGLSQLKDNTVSIFKRDAAKAKAGLDGNVTWRLIWWAKIIDYTIFGPYLLNGKGLGVNLGVEDIELQDEALRSPHNFSMTILVRYGLPVSLVWLLFLFYLFQPLLQKNVKGNVLLWGSALAAFFINASFDVSLEGPMMAFPFWSIIGLYLMEQVEA